MRHQVTPRHVLAVSWSGRTSPIATSADDVRRSAEEFGFSAYDLLPANPLHPDDQVYVTGGPHDEADPGGAVIVHLSLARRTESGSRVTAAQERALLSPDDRGDRIRTVGPYAVAGRSDGTSPWCAVVDDVGLRQLFWTQGEGWAAMSTSPRVLARLSRARVDRSGLAAYSTIGFHLGRRTMFEGVHQLGPGGRIVLHSGLADVTSGPVQWPVRDDLSVLPLTERVQRTADLLRSHMDAYLSDPDPVAMELSGGLDSRTLLAAIPKRRRTELNVLTLRDVASRDATIATELTQRHRLRQTVVDLQGLHRLDDSEVGLLVEAATRRFECAADPISHAVLDWAEQQLPGGGRIHGVGGEVGRGFYYSLQPDAPSASQRLVTRLARWRMMPNASTQQALFANGFGEEARTDTLAQIHQAFDSYQGRWLQCTDEFYLRERMCRWAGTAFTTPAGQREVLGPLFDPTYLDLAHSCPPEHKRNSRFLCMVLNELDPELALMPLQDDRIPAQVAAGGAQAAAASARRTAFTFTAKARQRLRRVDRPATGTAVLAPRLLAWWRSDPARLDGLRATGLVDEQWLDRALASPGAGEPLQPSVASLGMCAILNEIGNTLRR